MTQTLAPAPWTFNRNYLDIDQVAQFQDAYRVRYDQLTTESHSAYDADFRGHLGGVFADQKAEDAATYLLQKARRWGEFDAQYARYRTEGYTVPGPLTDGRHRFPRILIVNRRYDNGRYGDFRIVVGGSILVRDGKIVGVMRKGAKTRGISLEFTRADVLVRSA